MKIKFESLKDISQNKGYLITAAFIVFLLALTPYFSRISSQELGNPNIINLELIYAQDSPFDENNDGVATTRDAIDISVKDSTFPFELNKSKIATKYEVYSSDNDESTMFCTGSEIACNFIGLLSSSEKWDDTIYMYYGKDGATYNNLLGAQILYVNYNASSENQFTEVYYSELKNLSVTFTEPVSTFIEQVNISVSCEKCSGNSVPENSPINVTITIHGNASYENLSIKYDSWIGLLDSTGIESAFNETHMAVSWQVYGIGSIQKSIILSSPAYTPTPYSNQYSLDYSVADIHGSSIIDITSQNSTQNNPPYCNPITQNMKENTYKTFNLDDYCSDPENDQIEYAILGLDNAEFIHESNYVTVYPKTNFSGILEMQVAASDLQNPVDFILEVNVAALSEGEVSCEVSNQTIISSQNSTFNFSLYCIGKDAATYTLNPMANIEFAIENSTASLYPQDGFLGNDFTFVIANSQNKTYFSNVFAINVINSSPQVNPTIIIPENGFKMDEDADIGFEYFSKEELVRKNKWKAEYDNYEKPNLNSPKRTAKRELSLARQKKSWKSSNESINITIYDSNGDAINLDPEISKLRDGKFDIRLNAPRSFRAGRYNIEVTLSKDGVTYKSNQDFTWGVLAININKSIYLENESSLISIGVLDDEGKVLCNAKLDLSIKDPSNVTTIFSTEDSSIIKNSDCGFLGVTQMADYYAYYNTNLQGQYNMNLTAHTLNGIRTITDSFFVNESVDFDVSRTAQTRIYPLVPYLVNITIAANKNYSGPIHEYVPSSFIITPQNGMGVLAVNDTTTLEWNVTLMQGEVLNLIYEYDAPDISPEFYLLGPLGIGNFSESRQWQIANDQPPQILNITTEGILVYGVEGVATPQFRIWNGTNFSAELDSQVATGPINWTIVKAAKKDDEFIALMSNSSGALLMMVYNTTCWSNGTDCFTPLRIWVPTDPATNAMNQSKRGFDISYENLSGREDERALIVFSNKSTIPYYVIWNSTSKSLVNETPTPIINSYNKGVGVGRIELVSMENSNGENEIALLERFGSTDDLAAVVWNVTNSTWGCNATLSNALEAASEYKDFGADYISAKQSLFVVASTTGTNVLTANKTLNMCNWRVSGATASTEIGAIIDVVSDNIGNSTVFAISNSGAGTGADDVIFFAYRDGFLTSGGADTNALNPIGAPRQTVSCGGFGNGSMCVYSDDATTAVNYVVFNQNSNTWNALVSYTPTPAIGARWNNFFRQFPSKEGVDNRTFLFYSDSNSDLNVLMFNASRGLFSNQYSNFFGQSAIETTITSPSSISYDFAFRTFFAPPDIQNPVINFSFNMTNFYVHSYLNITANLTDETRLSVANITYNISGIKTYNNYSVSGRFAQISNATEITCTKGCIINVTIFVTDASNHLTQNSTIIIVNDTVGFLNASFNATTIRIRDVLNVSANITEPDGNIANGYVSYNVSGNPQTNFTFSGNGYNFNFSQAILINLSKGNAINFTVFSNDTYGAKIQNSTVFIVADTIGTITIGLNSTNQAKYGVLNISGNITEPDGNISLGIITYNISGNPQLNFTFQLSGFNPNFSQAVVLNLTKGSVINFTVMYNDTFGTKVQNSSLFTVNDSIGTVRIGINNTSPRIYEDINISINVSDSDENLSLAWISYNVSGNPGINVTFPISDSGYRPNASLTVRINLSRDGVYNFTAFYNDSYNFQVQNSTLITVANTVAVASTSLNYSNPKITDILNLTGNCTDPDGDIAVGVLSYNISGNPQLNFSFGTLLLKNANFSTAVTVNLTRSRVINFTTYCNDTFSSIVQNSTLITVDNTPPSQPQIIYPLFNMFSSRQPLPLNVTFANDADFDPITIRYYINARPNDTSTINTTFNASDGNYILNVSLFDGFNASLNASSNFTIDTLRPSVSLNLPLNGSYSIDGLLQMNYTGYDRHLSVCRLFTNFSGIWKENQSNSSTLSGNFTLFNQTQNTEGRFIWNVYCNDTEGNAASNSTNFTVIVDVNNPRIRFLFPTQLNNTNVSGATQVFNVTIMENNPLYLIFSLNDTLPNDTMSYSGIPNYTNLTKNNLHGTYSFYFWANDSAGRYNQTDTRIANIDSKYPQINLEDPADGIWNNSLLQFFRYNTTDDFLGTKNCSLVLELSSGLPFSNITMVNKSGTFEQESGNLSNITFADNSSYIYMGSETSLPIYEVSSFLNVTFNLSNIDPSIVTNLTLDVIYCHSGNPASGVKCNGVAPTGALELDQDVSFFNYSSRRWVRVGTLNNSQRGTEGTLARASFYPNATSSIRDFINSTSNQARVSLRSHFTNVLGENTFLVVDFMNLTPDTRTIQKEVENDVTQIFSRNIDSGYYNWSVECRDYASNFNVSSKSMIKIDKTIPSIINESINTSMVEVNGYICLNTTVNDTFSLVSSVIVEIERPESGLANISLTNDTSNPNSCSGVVNPNVWSTLRAATEQGMTNWTSTYVTDNAGNTNITHTFGRNWSQVASIFVNSTILNPLSNFLINESELNINYTFNITCNATCRPDSQAGCNDVTIFPQYFNDSWNDINNFSSQIIGFTMNKSCGNLAISQYCNTTFLARTSRYSGNNNFSIRCRAKGSNTPNDYSELTPNATVNQHPLAAINTLVNNPFLRGITVINSSTSFDDRNISNYRVSLDDNLQFSSPSTICSTNESNCTFNTFSQTQCTEDTSNCYILLNVTDNDDLRNSTLIQVQIDNSAPSVRLELPPNESYTSDPNIVFNYTAFDTNLSTCTLYHNSTGTFSANETNDTIVNGTSDLVFVSFTDNIILWNVLCNDTAGNLAFNMTNYTITVDTQKPRILFVAPTYANDTYTIGNNVLVNVSINDSNFANVTFYLYNSQLQLVNETNFTVLTTLLNFSNLEDSNEDYYYNVTVRDKVGFENSTETRKITLDNIYPRINFTNTPTNNTYANIKSLIVNVTLNETNFGNASFYLYDPSFALVNQTNITMTSELDNLSVNFSPSNLNQRYYYNVTIIDKTRLLNYTETREVVFDNLTPSIRLNAPTNNTFTLNNSIYFNFTLIDSNPKNCTLYANFSQDGEYKENISNNSVTSEALTIIRPDRIDDGFYVWNVLCYDLAGNYALNSTNYTIEIDSTAPSSFNLDQMRNATESINVSPFLNWSETFDAHFRNYTLIVDDAVDFSSPDFVYNLGGNYSNNSFDVPDKWTGNTRWYWKVTAYDLLNQSINSTDYFYYTIDNGTPQVNLSYPSNNSLITDQVINFKFNVTDLFSVANCSLLLNGEVSAVSDTISKTTPNTISYSPSNGDYNWSINCTDIAGNMNSSEFRNITVNAPSLLPNKFIDTTDVDFALGSLNRTNISGVGNGANVTLNYSLTANGTDRGNKKFVKDGNFTSRIFDAGGININFSAINWAATIPNTTNIVCALVDNGANIGAIFLRNGTHIIDASVASLAANINFASYLTYTVTGFNREDIVGCAMDDDANDMMWMLMRNGTAVRTIDLGAPGPNQALTFNVYSRWTMPSGLNVSDIIGFGITGSTDGSGNGNSSLFFKNGTHISSGQETGPFSFVGYNSYILPAGFDTTNTIGILVDDTANDVAMMFRNGSFVSDTTQATMNATISFTNGVFAFTVTGTGINLTESTNITLQTRASNDTVTWTPWSSIYSTPIGIQTEQTLARYIQYQSIFSTEESYNTPYLENVTINYTDKSSPRIEFVFPTIANNSFIRVDYVFVNSTSNDEHSTDKCRLEFDNVNQSMLISRNERNATCYLNKTSLSDGKYGFKVWANDTFGNSNSTEDRNITVDLTPPSASLFLIDPNPSMYTYENVSVNFTFDDIYLNSTIANVSFPNRTTLALFTMNFTLTPDNLSIPGNYSITLFANDSAGNTYTITDNLYVNDVTVPNVSLVSPLNITFTNNMSIIFRYIPKDDYNVSNCTLVLNNQANITNITVTEAISNNFSINLSDGEYNWSVNCTDNYMNTNGSDFRYLVVDTTPPNITLNYPVNDFNSTLDFIVFNWTPVDMFDINVSCNLTINDLAVAINLTNTTSAHINFTAVNLTEGGNKWNVTCIDDLNNTNTSITRNFTVVKGPSLINATLMPDNESINLTWISVPYAESYNVFIKDSFDDDFGSVANFTGTHRNFTDYNAANKTTRFYKIATVKGSVNVTSTRTLGKYEFELLNNSDSTSDWVLFSLPLNITSFLLNNGTNNATNLITKPLYCIRTLWSYNATSSEFKRTDFNGTAWIPAAGSENFTSLSQGRGYWAEINKTCNITFVGEVPSSNTTFPLETGWNVVGFYSANSSRLPQSFLNSYPVVVNPANSVKAVDRYNSSTDLFEVTVHFTVGGQDWGWVPSSANRGFTTLDPTKGYYYDVLNTATWTHKPVS